MATTPITWAQVEQLRTPPRKIDAISAVLLPFTASGEVDLAAYATLLRRTLATGIVPAVNMDTGYVNLLTPEQKRQVLQFAKGIIGARRFVAGAFVEGYPGDPIANYRQAVQEIVAAGGTPILFPSFALQRMSDDDLVAFHREIGSIAPQFLAFELGQQFVPFGRVYTLAVLHRLMQIPQLAGLKHSSLDRLQEVQRLIHRNQHRPDFRIYTGNDLAIDMVVYGSDYLLGLSAMQPEAFALRDRLFEQGNPRFWQLNDLLQYMGAFAFRNPVPAYKHTVAQFLKIRGVIPCDAPHPKAACRPDSDKVVLTELAQRLDGYCQQITASLATGGR